MLPFLNEGDFMKKTLIGVILGLCVPVFIFAIGTSKINQTELCHVKNISSSASAYSMAFSNQFNGCKIQLSRR